MLIKAVEGLAPEVAIVVEPLMHFRQSLPPKGAPAMLAIPAAMDQPRLLEDVKVAGYCWSRNGEGFR